MFSMSSTVHHMVLTLTQDVSECNLSVVVVAYVNVALKLLKKLRRLLAFCFLLASLTQDHNIVCLPHRALTVKTDADHCPLIPMLEIR